MGSEEEGQGAEFDAQRRCARRTVEEEAESSAGEEEPADLHEWGAEEEAGFPDSLVWWEVVVGGRKQGPGMEAEEGGLRGSLWMEEVEAELSCAGEEEAVEEEELHHGKGVEAVLGERKFISNECGPAHSLWPLPHTAQGSRRRGRGRS